jgi:hypothetical protein
LFTFGFPWHRVSDSWLASESARWIFGAAAFAIVGSTVVLCNLPRPEEVTPFLKLLLGIAGTLGPLGFFFLWGGMLHYWKSCDLSSHTFRRLTFLFLVLGAGFGAIAYYVLVYLPNTINRSSHK